MAAPANYPLTVRIGDTETVQLTLEDSSGAAINITGRSYAAQIRPTADSSTVTATFNCAVTNGAAGQMTATLPASTTSSLSAGSGVWDLQETNGTVVTTLLAGPVTIVQDVTR